MNRFIVLHTYKPGSDPLAFWNLMQTQAPGLAAEMQAGRTPARALYTWNPVPYGRTDIFACLWEAETAEDIVATMGAAVDPYVTMDIMRVDEIAWADLAKLARAA